MEQSAFINHLWNLPCRCFCAALGFGNVLWKGVKEAVDENGFIGIFMGGFKASAVGISAALIFGYIASLVFNPKMKR